MLFYFSSLIRKEQMHKMLAVSWFWFSQATQTEKEEMPLLSPVTTPKAKVKPTTQ